MKMNIAKVLGLAAVAGLLAVAAPVGGAQALSLSNPAASTAAKQASGALTTDVHWRRHRGWHRHHGWHRHRHWHRRHWY
jgi:hypothetical protein